MKPPETLTPAPPSRPEDAEAFFADLLNDKPVM